MAGGEFGGIVGAGVRVVEVLFCQSSRGVGGVGGVPEVRLAAVLNADVASGVVGERSRLVSSGVLRLVVHAFEQVDEFSSKIWIISARKATSNEVQQYEDMNL